jgi:hypothetical protein
MLSSAEKKVMNGRVDSEAGDMALVDHWPPLARHRLPCACSLLPAKASLPAVMALPAP